MADSPEVGAGVPVTTGAPDPVKPSKAPGVDPRDIIDNMVTRAVPSSLAGGIRSTEAQARKYVNEDFGYLPSSIRDNEDFYATNQSGLEKIGKGLLKLPLYTVTKLGSGVGFLTGMVNPMNWFSDDGYFNAVADNGITKVFDSLEDSVKTNWLPTFQEAKDVDKGFFARAVSDIDFWTEDVVDGAAFMASAFIPGMALSKLGTGMKMAQGLSRFRLGLGAAAETVDGLETAANYLRGASTLAKTLDKGTTWALATSSEAMFEAKGVRDNVLKSLENSGLTDQEKKEIAGGAARNTFFMNAALLGVTNVLELNYLYKALGKTEGVAGRILAEGLTDAAVAQQPATLVGKFLASNKGQFLKGAASSVLREGLVEENMQLAIQRTNEQFGAEKKVATVKDYLKVLTQYGKQTVDAFSGDDQEAAMNIGMGGLLGGVMGGVGEISQAKRDRAATEFSVNQINETQDQWLKFSNIYKTQTVNVTDANGNTVREQRMVLDQKGRPQVDTVKVASVISDLKLSMDAMEQSRLATDPLQQKLYRESSFAKFVQAHVNAGMQDQLMDKIEKAAKASPDELIKMGFDSASPNLDKTVGEYKALAAAIIKQNKLIESDILFSGADSDAGRKSALLNLASRQAVLDSLTKGVLERTDATKMNFSTEQNSSLSDDIVDQLNLLKFRTDIQERQVETMKADTETKPADLAIHEKVLSELKAQTEELIKNNGTTLETVKANKDGYYQYEKADRNSPVFINSHYRNLADRAVAENSARALGLEFARYADAKEGQKNFEDAQAQLQEMANRPDVEDMLSDEEEGKKSTITFTNDKGEEETMDIQEGQTFIGKLTKIEKYSKYGKNPTAFNNDTIKIVAISDDGKTISISVNDEPTIDVDAEEMARLAKEQKWKDVKTLTDVQKAYLALRNKIISYQVIDRDANNKQISKNGKYQFRVVRGRVSLGGKNKTELQFKYVNPANGKIITTTFEARYVQNKTDITNWPNVEALMSEQTDRTTQNYRTQVQFFTELITDTEKRLAEINARRNANRTEYFDAVQQLEDLKTEFDLVKEDLRTNPYKRGGKSNVRKNLENLEKTLPAKIAQMENMLESLNQEKAELDNMRQSLVASRETYYQALGELDENQQPFDRAGQESLGAAVETEIDVRTKDQINKRKSDEEIDQLITETENEIADIDARVGQLQAVIDSAKGLLSKVLAYKDIFDILATIDDKRGVQLQLVMMKRQETDPAKLSFINNLLNSLAKGADSIEGQYTLELVKAFNEASKEMDNLIQRRDELAPKLIRLETSLEQRANLASLRERLNFLKQVQGALTDKYAQQKEQQAIQQRVAAAQANILKGLQGELMDDTYDDQPEDASESTEKVFEDPKPVLTGAEGMLKAAGKHLKDGQINTEDGNDRFYKFTESNSTANLFLMPVTAANDTFGIRREDMFKDDIKLVVVKKVGNDYKYVGIDGEILENPDASSIVYTSMMGNDVLLGADKQAAITQLMSRFAVKELSGAQMKEVLDTFITIRSDIKSRLAAGEAVYLPVRGKSNGIQAMLPKDPVTGLPQEHNLDGRLISENVSDWNNPTHPDGSPISLEVATKERVQGSKIKAGRAVIVKNNVAYRVFSRKLTKTEEDTVINALTTMTNLISRSDENPLSQEEQTALDDITRYLNGILYFSIPNKEFDTKESATYKDRLFFYKGVLFRGGVGYLATPAQIEANRAQILEGLRHNVNNALLSGKRKNEPFYTIDVSKDGTVTRKDRYTNYQHYMLAPRPEGTSPIYTNVPLFGKEASDVQMYSVYLNYNYDKEMGVQAPANPAAAQTELVKSTYMPLDKLSDGKYVLDITTPKGTNIRISFEVKGKAITDNYTTDAKTADGKAFPDMSQLKAAVEEILLRVAEDALNPQEYTKFEFFKEEVLQAPAAQPAAVVPVTSVQPAVGDDVINAIVAQYTSPAAAEEEDNNYSLIGNSVVETEDFQKFNEFIQSKLPQIGVNRMVHLIDGKAYGKFWNGAIYLYENAEIGTGYHEAFEAVWNSYLTNAEQQDLISEFKNRKNYQDNPIYKQVAELYKGASEDTLIKEVLAEEFRAYVLAQENNEKPAKSLGSKILNFFKELYNTIKSWLGLAQQDRDEVDDQVTALFKKINAGGYANAVPVRDLSKIAPAYRVIPQTSTEFTKSVVDGITSQFFINLYKSQQNIDALFLNKNNNKLFQSLMESTLLDKQFGVLNKMVSPFTRALAAYTDKKGGSLTNAERQAFVQAFQNADPNLSYKLYLASNVAAQKEAVEIFKLSLEKFGFEFSEKIDEDELNLLMSKEESVENPLGIVDSINVDPRKMTAANVRMLLGSLTDDQYDANGVIRPKLNSVGLYQNVNYGKVINGLLNDLNGIVSVYKDGEFKSGLTLMMEKLDRKYKVNGRYKDGFVWIQRLKSRLKIEDFSGTPIDAASLTEDDIRLMTAFEKNFTNNQNVPLKVILGKDNATFTTNPVDAVNANRIRTQWENKLKANVTTLDKKGKERIVYVDNEGKIVFDKESQDFYTLKMAVTMADRIDALKLLGIEFTYPGLILNEETVGGKQSMQSRLNEAYDQIINGLTAQKAKDQINSFDDLFGRRKVNSAISALLNIESEMVAEENILSHRTADGKTQYSITLPSNYSYIINSLNSVSNQADFVRSNPQYGTVDKNGNVVLNSYQANSILLKRGGLIFDENGQKKRDITYHLISGMGILQEEDGKPTDKLLFADRLAQEVHYLLDGIYYTVINSDKASEFGMNLGAFASFADVSGPISSNTYVINMYLDALEDEIETALFEKKAKNTIQNYTKGVQELGHFSEILPESVKKVLNDQVYKGKMSVQDFLIMPEVTQAIGSYLETQSTEVLEALVNNGILVRNALDANTNTYLTNVLSKETLSTMGVNPQNMNEATAQNLAQYLAVNKQLSVFEQHKLIYGHPRLYTDLAKRSNGATSTKEAISDNRVVLSYMDQNMKRVDGKVRLDGNKAQSFAVRTYEDVSVVSERVQEIAESLYAALTTDGLSKSEAEQKIGASFTEDGILKSVDTKRKDFKQTYIEKFVNLNEADAQARIMPDFYRDMLFLSAKWSKDQQKQFEYEMAYETVKRHELPERFPSSKKVTEAAYQKAKAIVAKGSPGVVLPVLKPQYFGYNAKANIQHVVFLKNSVQPMFYRFVEGTSLEKLYIQSQNNQDDIIGFESGQKVGNVLDKNGKMPSFYNADGSINNSNLPVRQELLTRFMGIQVEQPSVFKDKVVRGTQVSKLIMSNFMKDGMALNATIGDLIALYNKTIEDLVKIGKEELLEELGLTIDDQGNYEIEDLSELVSTLRNEAERRNLPDNVIENIAVLETDNGQTLKVPFDALPIRTKIDNIINSIIDSRVITDKMSGKPLVQVASTGYELTNRKQVYLKDGVYTAVENLEDLSEAEMATIRTSSSDLKFYTKKDGKISSMEVYLPWYFKNLDIEDFGLIKRGGVYMVDPKSTISQKLLQAIGFRIPTQGMNSIENITIKGFLPMEAGDMIVVPSEIVGKSGSDFDIDKMNTYLPNYYVLNRKVEYIDPSMSEEELTAVAKKVWASKNNTSVGASELVNAIFGEDKDEQSFIRKFKKQALQNRLIETMGDLMSQPENYRQLITPNGATEMKKRTEEIMKLKGLGDEEKSFTKLSELVPMAVTRERYVLGKQLVGIAALQTTAHTMFQIAGIELTGLYSPKRLKFLFGSKQAVNDQRVQIRLSHNSKDGKLILDALKGTDGNYISEMHSEALTGFVDAAKDPFVFYLNLSLDTAGTWFYLQKLGVDLDSLSFLFTQPAIESYFKAFSGNRTLINRVNNGKVNNAEIVARVIDPYLAAIFGKSYNSLPAAIQEAVENDEGYLINDMVATAIKGATQGYRTNRTFTADQMKSALERMSKPGYRITANDARMQISLLADYLEYKEQAANITDFIRAISYDNKSTKSIIENRLQEANWSISEQNQFIKNPEAILDKTFIGEMKTQKEDIFKMYEKFFVSLDPRAKAVFEPAFRKIADPDIFMTGDEKQEFLNRYHDFYINYLLHTVSSVNNGMQTTLNKKYALLFGDQSVAASLRSLQDSTDPMIKNNLFLKELYPVISSDMSKPSNIKLFRKRLDKYEMDQIMESANGLYQYAQQIGDRKLKGFIENVAALSILQSGVQPSPISYTSVLPVEIYSKIVSNILDSYKTSGADVDPKLVWKQFHQNNWRNDSLVPRVENYYIDDSGILAVKGADAANDYVAIRQYRKEVLDNPDLVGQYMQDKNWDAIYEYKIFEKVSPQHGFFRPINKLGDGFRFTEAYNNANAQSAYSFNEPFDETPLMFVTVEDIMSKRKKPSFMSADIDEILQPETPAVPKETTYGPEGLPAIEDKNKDNC